MQKKEEIRIMEFRELVVHSQDHQNNEFEIIELTEPKICRDAISIFLESIEEEAYLKDEKLLVIELKLIISFFIKMTVMLE